MTRAYVAGADIGVERSLHVRSKNGNHNGVPRASLLVGNQHTWSRSRGNGRASARHRYPVFGGVLTCLATTWWGHQSHPRGRTLSSDSVRPKHYSRMKNGVRC